MKPHKTKTHNTPSLAATCRRSAFLAFVTIVLSGLVPAAQAALLLYEPFNYTSGLGTTLNNQSGGTGFAAGSLWFAWNSNTYPSGPPTGFAICDATMQTLWNGTVTSVPQTGNYAGSPAPAGNPTSGYNGNNPDHEWASRPLDPSITAGFTLGATTWMSYVEASDFKANANGTGGSFAIGSGTLGTASSDNRGWTAYDGWAIGIGVNSAKYFTAGFWDPSLGTTGVNLTGTNGTKWLTTGAPQIGIAKIVWGDASTPTTIYQVTFNDGATLTEAAFNSSTNLVVNTALVDPTICVNVMLGGARYNVDELRIGTTFNDVIGVIPATDGAYWAPGLGGGGSGTWATGSHVWSAVPNSQGTLPQRNGVPLVFSGTNATSTVTINGTVAADAGLTFPVTGYSIVPGSSTPTLNLTGADATANTITVVSGTAAISAGVTNSTGMTKAGAGTLILSGANTFTGDALLNAGIMQIADANSLGAGKATFGGGTLQYPPGSGASAIDVSAKINPVASGQIAKIDTDGYDVTFSTAIGGAGGLTKLGSGSLTLAAANTYTGPTTVSAGTLNVTSASGTIATLNVPVGGTVNLGAGAVVTALNVTGGTVNVTGAGVQVGTLFASGGTLNASGNVLSVMNSASLNGITVNLTGASAFTLSGANIAGPTALNHTTLTASGGMLSFDATGLDAALGIAAPGIPAVPAKATFSGSGVWTLAGGVASDINNVYGKDNHAFHYIPMPSGDFDIVVHVTGATNAAVGLMARDNLVSAWSSHVGNSAGIWTTLGTSIVSSTTSNGVFAFQNGGAGAPTPWLEVKKIGNLVGMYYSEDGVTFTPAQEIDYSFSPWGPTTYLGLDLINTTTVVGEAGGDYDSVNFMGTAGTVDMSTTDFALNGGAQVNLGFVMTVSSVSTNSVALARGCWGSTLSGAVHVDDAHFQGTGMVVIPPLVPLTINGLADITVSAPDPNGAVVNYPEPTATGGTAPYTLSTTPASGSMFPLGTNIVTCTVTDSSCPAQTKYGVLKVIVLPPTPLLPLSGFSRPGGVPTFEVPDTVAGFLYTLVYKDNLTAASWTPLDGSGVGVGNGSTITLSDPTPVESLPPHRFYRIQVQ